jgi:hypothetical protein
VVGVDADPTCTRAAALAGREDTLGEWASDADSQSLIKTVD